MGARGCKLCTPSGGAEAVATDVLAREVALLGARKAETRTDVEARNALVVARLRELIACSVCLDAPMRKPTSTHCGHVFCAACIAASVKAKPACPLCNAKVKKGETHEVFL